jgi:hypothetical protein
MAEMYAYKINFWVWYLLHLWRCWLCICSGYALPWYSLDQTYWTRWPRGGAVIWLRLIIHSSVPPYLSGSTSGRRGDKVGLYSTPMRASKRCRPAFTALALSLLLVGRWIITSLQWCKCLMPIYGSQYIRRWCKPLMRQANKELSSLHKRDASSS